MKHLFTLSSLFFFLVWGLFMANAQINYPRISPACTLTQKIGHTEIEIAYSRPGVRGRAVMGALVPYGRIWRVGANESTKIRFSEDVWLAEEKLPAGTYALYAIPERDQWTIILHKNLTHWGDGRDKYNPAEDQLRIQIKPEKMPYIQESFLIDWHVKSHSEANLQLKWEQTQISIPVRFDTDAQTLAEIEKQIRDNPTADTYYQAARYYHESGQNPEQARKWLIKAQELAGDKYYIHRVRSLIEAELGNYAAALEHAQKSREISESLGKDEFVRMNDENIRLWTYKKKKAEGQKP